MQLWTVVAFAIVGILVLAVGVLIYFAVRMRQQQTANMPLGPKRVPRPKTVEDSSPASRVFGNLDNQAKEPQQVSGRVQLSGHEPVRDIRAGIKQTWREAMDQPAGPAQTDSLDKQGKPRDAVRPQSRPAIGTEPARHVQPAPTNEDAGQAEQKRRWAFVRDRLRDAQVRAAQYELDPALAIDYPAFNDVTVPEVSAMTKALRTATRLHDAASGGPIGGTRELLIEFEAAVSDYETAIDIAERAARRLRWDHLPKDDRKDLEQIQALLAHAMSEGNTAEARQTYYAQLQRSIRRLNDRHGAQVIPAEALAAIESRARLELTQAERQH